MTLVLSLVSWELFIAALALIIGLILTSPIISRSEFIFTSGLQITNFRFLIGILRVISFYWASRCVSFSSQEFSGTLILFLKLSLLSFLLLFFFASETFNLYVLFELSVIPIFVIIIGWGYQRERLEARLRMIFYTITASLPLLGAFILVSFYSLTRKLLYLDYLSALSNSSISHILTFRILAAFIVKLPIYGVHLWLPKAHVEAPVYGSMILAAILLKLGSFGILVFSPYVLRSNVSLYISLSLVGGVTVSFLCLRLTDLKIIIAYSSVAHMGCVLVPVILHSALSSSRGIFLIRAHAVSSSSIFLIAYYLYQINFSRSLLLTKGVLLFSRAISLMWFLVLIINIAAPPTLNLLAEILIISRVIYQNNWNFLILILIILVGSAYTLIIYRSSIQGRKTVSLNLNLIRLAERLNVYNHVIWGATFILAIPLLNF